MPRIKPKQNSATICLIVRDEAPYILEWIAHYQSLGVQDFIVYDNESKDKTPQLLAALANSGVIQHFSIEKENAQRRAYASAVKHCKTEWIGFLDIDEFVKVNSHTSIPEFLSSFGSDIASVSLNWKSFGSSGHHFFSRQPVTTRFTHTGVGLELPNMWTKYFARVETLIKPDIHTCSSKRGRKHVLADGSERLFTFQESTVPNHEFASIYHYVIKSHEEALFKVKVRGQGVNGRLAKYNEMFMLTHDVNEVEDLGLALRWGQVSTHLAALQEVSVRDGWANLFNECAPTPPHVPANQKLWPLKTAGLVQDFTRAKETNLDCLLISNDASCVTAISSLAAKLGFTLSGMAPDFLDSDLQDALEQGQFNLAAKRAKQLLKDGSQFLSLVIDSKSAKVLKDQDIAKKLGLKPKHVIGILRDPLASSIKTGERNIKAKPVNPGTRVKSFMAAYSQVVWQLETTESPKLWLTAEGLLQNEGALISNVAGFLGVDISPMDFQAIKFPSKDDLGMSLVWDKPIDGKVESLINGIVTGWARCLDVNKPAVTIRLSVNHKLVSTSIANLRRNDLATSGNATCGFEIELPPAVKPGDVISVLVQDEKFELNNSPAVYLG